MLQSELRTYVEEVCQIKKNGGRIVLLSPAQGILLLTDIAYWTDDMAVCTKHTFPEVNICVQQSRSSLSGFCIVFSLDERFRKTEKGSSGPSIHGIVMALAAVFIIAAATSGMFMPASSS
jgi:hypothetical protein